MIDFRYKVFLEVARHLNFSRAAETLFVSQPAISKHIKMLEQHYQFSLFERKGNQVSLTVAGKVLYQKLVKSEFIEKQLEYELSALQSQQNARGELKLGASTTMTLYILPQILSAFRRKFPLLFISVLNANTENITRALLNNEIDMGIVESFGKMSEISYAPFIADEIVLVTARHSPYASLQKISLAELARFPIASRERGSGTLESVKQALTRAGYNFRHYKPDIVLGGTEALKNFLLTDPSIGFLPVAAVQKELQAGDFVKIELEGIKVRRQYYFIFRQGEEANPGPQSFVKHARSSYNKEL